MKILIMGRLDGNNYNYVFTVRGGMSLREGILLVEEVFLTGRLNAVDLVEVNPQIGDSEDVNRTVNAANQIIKAACGFDRLGKLPSKNLSC